METIALADGDLGRLFPAAEHDAELRQALARADDQVLRLARHLGGRAGWTGHGVEYHSFPSGQLELVALAEGADATFWAELRPAGFYAHDTHPTGWYVAAEITVRCDHEVDCGTHTVEERDERHFAEAREAVGGFLADVAWLLGRAEAEAPGYWRAHDPLAAR